LLDVPRRRRRRHAERHRGRDLRQSQAVARHRTAESNRPSAPPRSRRAPDRAAAALPGSRHRRGLPVAMALASALRFAPEFQLRIGGQAFPSLLRAWVSSVSYQTSLDGADRVELTLVNDKLRWLDHPLLAL